MASWLCMGLSGCGQQAPQGPAVWSGYVEGDFVRVAAPVAGRLQTLSVREGQTVAAGTALFELDDLLEQRQQSEAQARSEAAAAQALDTGSGKRRDELAVTQAQLAQARAQAALARSDLARHQQLAQEGFVAPARIDDARSAVRQADARVAELEAALRAARLPARSGAQAAAEAAARAASDAAAQVQWRLEQTGQTAPATGEIAQIYFRPGEWVAAGQSVLSMLPEGAVKLRFFIAQDQLASVRPGQTVQVHCDGCPSGLTATVRSVATQAEYTPPVIYSNSQRARLVFRVEAQPEGAARAALRPGQPIDVSPAAGAGPAAASAPAR